MTGHCSVTGVPPFVAWTWSPWPCGTSPAPAQSSFPESREPPSVMAGTPTLSKICRVDGRKDKRTCSSFCCSVAAASNSLQREIGPSMLLYEAVNHGVSVVMHMDASQGDSVLLPLNFPIPLVEPGHCQSYSSTGRYLAVRHGGRRCRSLTSLTWHSANWCYSSACPSEQQ